MDRLTINTIGVAVLGIVLVLHVSGAIDIGAGVWVVAVVSIFAAFNVISRRREQEESNG
ncbi:hypothetical protein AAG612_02115 [Citromicrobium bathyomarinum]|uniref:hypothetical protein n=1 Tax=Citromicrobium bathyomarinum TaxID=72174 RepID=UPI00315B2219